MISRQEAEPPHADMYTWNTGHTTAPYCCSSPLGSHEQEMGQKQRQKVPRLIYLNAVLSVTTKLSIERIKKSYRCP